MKAKTNRTIPALAAAILLAGCGGGDSGSATGTLSLSVTDAPVDQANKVMVEFTGVSIKPESGEVIEFLYDTPRTIDLLALQGNDSEILLDGRTVPAGRYNWVRLHVNAERGVLDSYISRDDGDHSLYVPSQTGLKLVSGFTVPEGGIASFTIDFDLRKSVKNPQGFADYKLDPALRMVDTEVGAIHGTVALELLSDPATCSDDDMDTGNAVYVYTGSGTVPDDLDGKDPDPVTTALVKMNTLGEYEYTAGFLPPGSYTVAFTCQADLDDADRDDLIVLQQAAEVSVVTGRTSTRDFLIP